MNLYPLIEDSRELTPALLARVSAGDCVEIGDEIEEIDLNWLLTKGNPWCMLIRVRGESMSSEIRDGDWVMIDRRREPQGGDIILARLSGGYTIKRHKPHGHDGRNGLYLVPANDIYKPRRVTADDAFEIIGVVTHVIHQTV